MNKREIKQYLLGISQVLGGLSMPATEQNASIMHSVYQTLHHIQELVDADKPESEEKSE